MEIHMPETAGSPQDGGASRQGLVTDNRDAGRDLLLAVMACRADLIAPAGLAAAIREWGCDAEAAIDALIRRQPHLAKNLRESVKQLLGLPRTVSTAQVLGAPNDDYTRRLLASLPVPDPVEQAARRSARMAAMQAGR